MPINPIINVAVVLMCLNVASLNHRLAVVLLDLIADRPLLGTVVYLGRHTQMFPEEEVPGEELKGKGEVFLNCDHYSDLLVRL